MSAETTKPNSKRKKRRSRTHKPQRPNVECRLCGKQYKQITKAHLRTHGYTLDQYKRTFGVDTTGRPCVAPTQHTVDAAQLRRELEPDAVAKSTTTQVAEGLLSSPQFIEKLTHEVSELLFTTSLRTQLRGAVVHALGKRMELHAKATANLEAVRDELSEDWRVKRGGKNGEPTPTPHLVMMASQAAQEVNKTEDALLKTLKLAVDEQRSNKEVARTDLRPAFSGDTPAIPVPPSLPAHERETVRTLFQLYVNERKSIDVEAQVRTPGDSADTVHAEPSTAPPAEFSNPTLSASATAEHPVTPLGRMSTSPAESLDDVLQTPASIDAPQVSAAPPDDPTDTFSTE